MTEATGSPRATREAVQPSLWDRLVNDLPGLGAEIAAERQALGAELGTARVDALLAGGARAIDGEVTLADDERGRLRRLLGQEARRADLEARGIVVSPQVLREAVRRDIEALFNSERFQSRPLLTDHEAAAGEDPPDLADYPEARRSVVNYGVPPFSGRTSRDFDREVLAREIRAVLAAFEPRLKESATRVTVTVGGKSAGLTIEIDGLLIMAPAPERLRLKTMIDLDNGRARTDLRDR
jgi:type VI secretion system protein ImpF